MRHGAACLLPQPARADRHDVVVGDGVGDGLAHQRVVQRLFLRVQQSDIVKEGRVLIDHKVGVGLAALQCLCWQREGQVDFAALEHLRLHHLFGDDADDHFVELVVVPAAPVVLKASEDDLLVRGVALQHPRSGTGLVPGLEPLRVLQRGGVGAHYPGGIGGGGDAVQGVGGGEGKADGRVVHCLDIVHHPPDPGSAGAQGAGALDGGDHRVGVQFAAVVELDPLAQVEGPSEAILRDIPRFGQRWLETAVGLDPHQWLIDVCHVEGLGGEGSAGVPRGDRCGGGDAQDFGCGLGRLLCRRGGRLFGGSSRFGRGRGGGFLLGWCGRRTALDQGQAKQTHNQDV